MSDSCSELRPERTPVACCRCCTAGGGTCVRTSLYLPIQCSERKMCRGRMKIFLAGRREDVSTDRRTRTSVAPDCSPASDSCVECLSVRELRIVRGNPALDQIEKFLRLGNYLFSLGMRCGSF